MVAFRLDRELLDRLDEVAKMTDCSRPEAFRAAVLAWCEGRSMPREPSSRSTEVPMIQNPVDLQKARDAFSDLSLIRRSLPKDDADAPIRFAAFDSAAGILFRLLQEVCHFRGQDPRVLERNRRPSDLLRKISDPVTPEEAGRRLEELIEDFRSVPVWDYRGQDFGSVVFGSLEEKTRNAAPKTVAFVKMIRFVRAHSELLRQVGRGEDPEAERLTKQEWWYQHCVEHCPEITDRESPDQG